MVKICRRLKWMVPNYVEVIFFKSSDAPNVKLATMLYEIIMARWLFKFMLFNFSGLCPGCPAFYGNRAACRKLPRNEFLCQFLWGSNKMKVWHQWQLKKSKSWGPFWSYQLDSTANSAHFARFLGSAVWLVAPKRPPRIWYFSIVLGAEYFFMWNSLLRMHPHFWAIYYFSLSHGGQAAQFP